jgi:acyl-CoA thioesterase FadM
MRQAAPAGHPAGLARGIRRPIFRRVNLLLRLLWLAVAGRFRRAVPALGPCRTPFRVLPTDLDVLRHVNNGVYFSLMDLARVDLMRRAGLLGKLAARGWYPVAAAETIQFRRPLTLLQRFDIVTRVLAWDEKAFLVEQRFERGGEAVALAFVRARFLRRAGGGVAPAEVLALAGLSADAAPGEVPAAAANWNREFSAWLAGPDAASRAGEQRPTVGAD